MKKVRIIRRVDQEKDVVIDEYNILEEKDMEFIKKELHKKGMTISSLATKNYRAISYVYNVYKCKSNCADVLKYLQQVGIIIK